MLSLQIDLQSLEDAWVGHTSQKYSFGKLYFGKFNSEIEIWMLLVIALRKYMTSRGLLTVQRHRHSWNLKDYGQPTKYRAAGVGARGAYASKNFTFVTLHLHLGIVEPLRPLMEKQIPKLLLKYQDDDASPRSLATRTFTQRWWLRSSLGSYFPPDWFVN